MKPDKSIDRTTFTIVDQAIYDILGKKLCLRLFLRQVSRSEIENKHKKNLTGCFLELTRSKRDPY